MFRYFIFLSLLLLSLPKFHQVSCFYIIHFRSMSHKMKSIWSFNFITIGKAIHIAFLFLYALCAVYFDSVQWLFIGCIPHWENGGGNTWWKSIINYGYVNDLIYYSYMYTYIERNTYISLHLSVSLSVWKVWIYFDFIQTYPFDLNLWQYSFGIEWKSKHSRNVLLICLSWCCRRCRRCHRHCCWS